MKCKNCGNNNNLNSQYCSGCGTLLAMNVLNIPNCALCMWRNGIFCDSQGRRYKSEVMIFVFLCTEKKETGSKEMSRKKTKEEVWKEEYSDLYTWEEFDKIYKIYLGGL